VEHLLQRDPSFCTLWNDEDLLCHNTHHRHVRRGLQHLSEKPKESTQGMPPGCSRGGGGVGGVEELHAERRPLSAESGTTRTCFVKEAQACHKRTALQHWPQEAEGLTQGMPLALSEVEGRSGG